MQDLSLHLLDIAENSVRAKATLIEIVLDEQPKKNQLTLKVSDNGIGMNQQMLRQVENPFFTTRTTRRIGLGIPLLKQNCQQSGGNLLIASQLDKGTQMIATMQYHHIDRLPLGDMVSTLMTLISANPKIDWVYEHALDRQSFIFDTRQVKGILEEMPLNQPSVLIWIKDYLLSQEGQLKNE